MSKLTKCSAVAAVAALGCLGAQGVTYTYWQGPACGDWWNAANWSAGVPVGGDFVPRFSRAHAPEAGSAIAVTNAAAVDCAYLPSLPVG